ncbi:MAG: DNA topoisomerase IV subunit A, partial [Kiritimatiellae bacterium]|nr:DNA topoisomerase IV subunit A [Kiritimatiellia bacterium]
MEDAIKKKKVKIRKIHDLTSADVHIELELQAGENPAKVKTALYAFTSCEKSIASRPIVLDGGRPRAMTITQILQRNVDRLLFLTKRELEIRLDELDALFHARTLDRIFVEERIYKRIENEKTYEGVQTAVLDGFKPFRSELRRDVTLEDVERLLKIPIRRISQFDIDKNRDEIKNILAEEEEVRDNLAHLRAFTVKYLKGLISQYRKKYPRCTQ